MKSSSDSANWSSTPSWPPFSKEVLGQKAFRSDVTSESVSESTQEAVNRKATIVIEHLIQASDAAHTMQYWHVYIKWNERLFHELYKAYLTGRADKDPSETWYQGGELGFYTKNARTAACGVFGVARDEDLDYATGNRIEWAIRGKRIGREYLIMQHHKKDGMGSN
jgi:hypothetical protein